MGHVAGALTDEICDIEGFLDSLLGVRSRADNYRAVLRRDPCAFCGHRRKRMTIDHIEPVARGGRNGWMNLTGACYACNASKRTISLLDFLHGL